MTPNALENLVRWNLQIALLAIVAAVLLHVLKVSAPVIRHAFWRMVVVVCLALPVVQPWTSTVDETPMQSVEAAVPASSTELAVQASSAAGSSLLARLEELLRLNWVSFVGMVLGCGVVLRLAWLVIGIHGLYRLRRAGEPALTEGGYEELAALIEAGAEIRRVERLGQPVTFGVLKPAVLLPTSFSSLPVGVQRAVLAHELWHVRRRDWAWVLLEEGICAAFWFNPAMWWLISRVQSSREEVVDQLTVQLTNARKTYLEALLTFADEPTLFPAAPFARRRHLFHRMLLDLQGGCDVVQKNHRVECRHGRRAAGGWCLRLVGISAEGGARVVGGVQRQQNPPRDRRPGEPAPETARERELKDDRSRVAPPSPRSSSSSQHSRRGAARYRRRRRHCRPSSTRRRRMARR